MTGGGSLALRRDRVRAAFCRLAEDLESWLATWKDAGRQASQTAQCAAVLRTVVGRLGARIADLPTDERAFAKCRGLEWDVSLVEGLFRLLAVRFDQRRDQALAASLRAADEMIWSCLQQTSVLVDSALPLPLAYFDAAFSPSATPRVQPSPALPVRDRQLAEMLRVLPVPMIGLPFTIAEDPWWLVLVAHEVGHHVQYDVDAKALDQTGAELKKAAGEAWEAWREEVFADVFSVLVLGPVAIEAAAEFEWDSPGGMATARTRYPPVIVRLAVMAECARAAGFDNVPFAAASWTQTLDALAPAERGVVAEQLGRVEAVVAAVLDMPLGRASLRKLAAGNAPAKGPRPDALTVALQRRLKGDDVAVQPGRNMPRRAAHEAFRMYRGLSGESDGDKRVAAQRALSPRVLALINEVGDPNVKRASRELVDASAIADRMFEVLDEAV